MKASRYNRLFRAEDGAWLLFNSRTTALAEIDPSEIDFVRSMLADPDRTPCPGERELAYREGMIEGGFLVDDATDEAAAIKSATLRDRFRTDQLHLTIAPTLDCNFRCDYCYEEHLRVTMASAVQEALLEWLEQRAAGLREFYVCWYGGEPLLPAARKVVTDLSRRFQEISRQRGWLYRGQIVTNGYFLERGLMEELAELGIDSVQVTLDGPPEEHDRRRHLLGGQGTFHRIVENMKQCVDLASFQVRINVDQRNAMSTLDAVRALDAAGLARRVRIYLAQVTFDGAACGNIQELCYSTESFARTEVEIYRQAARAGLPLGRYPNAIPGAFCTADRAGGFVIAPNGLIFKCWHEVTMNADRAIGSLLDGQQPFQAAIEERWLAWDTFDKAGCKSCDVMPLCHGGCPLEAMRSPDSERGACEHSKFALQPLLEVRRLAGAGPSPQVPRGGTGCPS